MPGSSFFSPPELGRSLVRFAFCKRMETLEKAAERLRDFSDGRGMTTAAPRPARRTHAVA